MSLTSTQQSTELARLVAEELISLGDEFSQNELAYLAVTSKIEFPIRDRLAYRLVKRLASEGLSVRRAVAREWKRFDLAIVNDAQRAELLLEAKAWYTDDLYFENPKVLPASQEDKVKLLNKGPHCGDAPELLTLILLTHIHTPNEIATDWNGVVKYLPYLHKRKCDFSITNVFNAIRHQYGELEHPIFSVGSIEGGCAFGSRISVIYSIFGPFE